MELKRIQGSVFEFGDAFETLKQYDDEQVHLVVTSPPYFNQRTEYAEYMDFNDYLDQMAVIFRECKRILKPGRIFAVNIGQDTEIDLPSQISALLHGGGLLYQDTICWWKHGEIGTRGSFLEKGLYYPNYSWETIFIYRKAPRDLGMGIVDGTDFPSFDYSDIQYISTVLRTNVWDIIPEKGSWHPASFPIELPKNIIRCYTKKNDIVLDPFGGSGTTAVAAEQLHRRYFLIERMKEYYDKAVQRVHSSELTLGI